MTSKLRDLRIGGWDLRDCIWLGLGDKTSESGFWDQDFSWFRGRKFVVEVSGISVCKFET